MWTIDTPSTPSRDPGRETRLKRLQWRHPAEQRPVFNDTAFTQFCLDYCDTLLACYVLRFPTLVLPDELDGLAGNAGKTWHGLAETVMAEFFPTSS